MSEGCEADKFLKFPATPSSARCPERSAGTQTAGRLFFGYFSLAKQKKVTSRRATPGLVVKAISSNSETTSTSSTSTATPTHTGQTTPLSLSSASSATSCSSGSISGSQPWV